jgi:hypothetical protein
MSSSLEQVKSLPYPEVMDMTLEKHLPRLLGGAFLFVLFTSLVSGILHNAVIGSGDDIAQILTNIASNPLALRLSVLGQIVTSGGIIVLAVLLYFVTRKCNRVIALIALCCWLGEAIALAVSQMATAALIPLSLAYANSPLPERAAYLPLGQYLYSGVDQMGLTVLMFFYCCGGLLAYSLLYASSVIPRAIAGLGVLAVAAAMVAVVFALLGDPVSIFVSLPVAVFELTICAWLVLRGTADRSVSQEHGEHLPVEPGAPQVA